ncbi:hypothetical protein EJ03DRAFT_368038 [Teratosphaeria nubilosa]|uniref:alpha-1,2-Mannosidase n=1 Tax=Teratosphaeria nubilosa TaxID=161662 RepID=A0A6G1LJM7_9PEZI|nr:hypothetical protein EJ03DRAFT_368038 [Teratosphaeria nubilosa]
MHPVSNCKDDFGSYGETAIDALPTAIMFGQENATVQILESIVDLDFVKVKGDTRIQVFEVPIRHLAAMISAWDLLNGPFNTMAVNHRIDLRQALYRRMVRLGMRWPVHSTRRVAYHMIGWAQLRFLPAIQ